MRGSRSPILIFIFFSTLVFAQNCGIKTNPTPLIRTQDELPAEMIQVESEASPVPSTAAESGATSKTSPNQSLSIKKAKKSR